MKRGFLKSQTAENQPPEPSVPDTELSPGTFPRGGSLQKPALESDTKSWPLAYCVRKKTSISNHLRKPNAASIGSTL